MINTRHPYCAEAWFISIIMVCCLIFQRFGVPFGALSLNIAGPIGLGVAAFFVLTGTLSFDRIRLVIFLSLLVCIIIGYEASLIGMIPFNAQISTPSIIQFLSITSFATVRFTRPIPEDWFARRVNLFLAFVAVCGILQFFAQFAGIKIFQFSDYLPSYLLFETNWNLVISAGIGDLNKSNGFWLVEPSVMSQFMALAIMIEVLYMRRTVYLTLFGVGWVLAFSGTGGIVLAAFIISVAARLGTRGIVLALLLILVLAFVAVGAILISPEIGDMAVGRLSEFSTPGTSGFDRFVTPFWLLSDVWNFYPSSILLGIGGGTAEHLTMVYDYDVNTPVKIMVEYGIPALILYVSLFITASRSTRQSVIVLPGLVLLLFTGAYQQFAPVVYLVALLICIPVFPQPVGSVVRSRHLRVA